MPKTREQVPEQTASGRWIGRSVTRHEDERLLRGLGRFVDDHDPPGVLAMAVGRCPYPHARVRRIDAEAARELPGVEAVLTGADVAALSEPISVLRTLPEVVRIRFWALAQDVALFEGHPVVSVVAQSRYVAEDALELIRIEYEPLPHVADVESALAPGAPVLHDALPSNLIGTVTRSSGDPDGAMAGTAAVVSDQFAINRVTGLPMEGRAVLADYTPGLRTLTVWTSTQVPYLVRMQLAHALRLPEEAIRVVGADCGGGFGLKLGIYPEDILACLHAMQLGRPVKWIEDRMEHFRATTHARESVHNAALAADAGGRLVAMRNVYTVDNGAYISPFGAPRLTTQMFPGPYRIRDCHMEGRVVATNKTPVGAYRGYGQPESNFVREVLMDRLARALNLDPVELRRRNLLTPAELPWESAGGSVYESGDYARTLDLAAEQIGYADLRRRQPQLRAAGRYLGVGLACYVEKTGYPGSAYLGKAGSPFGGYESVTIRLGRSGTADLYTGVAQIGQSSETAFAQLCAHCLGMEPAAVRVHAGDTQGAPFSVGSFSSRTLIAGAGAIEAAAREIRAKVLRIAAHLLEATPDQLELTGGAVRVQGDPRVRVPLARVAAEAATGHHLPPGEAPGLEATAYYDPQHSAYSYGTAAAVVSVTPRTGEFRLERFVLVHDCGTRVNPMLVDGQVRGGIAQALGAALFEELMYDADTGQLVNGSMVDYFVPTCADLPEFELDHTEVPSTVTPFGVRGVGESGTIPPAAAVANAICDALAPFGIEINRLPIRAERIWQALRQAGA